MPDDATLLRRFTDARDADAFAELVHRHLDAVYSAAFRRVGDDIHLAEDVAQQVFIALARRAPALLDHPALTAWLHLATRHAAANTVRTERRRKAREQAAFAMPAADSSSAPDWSRLAPLIDAAIDRLNDRDRAAVLLRFIENRSFAEVGAALQLSEDAARMRVARALEKLRSLLARQGIASTSTALGLALANHAVAAAPAGLAATLASGAFLSAAATPSSLGLLVAMTSSKSAVLLAGAALLAALGTASYEVVHARTAATALAVAQEENSALADRLRVVDAQVAAAERESAMLEQQLRERVAAADRVAAAAAYVVRPASTPDPTRDPMAEGKAFMDRHPAVRQALIDLFDAGTNLTWNGFYQAARLSPAQIAEFQALLRPPGFAYSQQMALGQPDLVLSFDGNRSDGELDARRRAVLGPDGYQKFAEYGQTTPAREFGAQLAGALAFTSVPLTAAQFDRLTHAMTTGHAIQMTPTGPRFDWAVITAKAETILSPEQRTVLAGLKADADYAEEFSRTSAALRAQPSQNSVGTPRP